MISRLNALLSLVLCAVELHAGDYSWVNVKNLPDDLKNTGDGWSAVRIEDNQFISHRCAADDFVVDAKTQITEIGFWNVDLGEPPIIAGDWYIYATDKGDFPGSLLHVGEAVDYVREDTGWTSKSFGTIYVTKMNPENLILEPGRYFLAFRTFQDYNPDGKNTVGALTTRVVLGEDQGVWNFDVLGDGSVQGAWSKMQVFNGQSKNEWAFYLNGKTEDPRLRGDMNCDGSVDFDDIDGFVLALTSRDSYETEYPDCNYLNADVNCDEQVDFDDIDGFVACVTSGGCADCP